MKDKLTAGLVAGFLAGIAGVVFEIIVVNLFHFGQPAFLRFAGGMLYTHAPVGLAEQVVATLMHLLFSAYLGGAFAYLLDFTSEMYELVKGVVWALFVTWVIWVATYLFQMRPEDSSIINALENDVSAIVYGLALAMFYRYLREKSPDQPPS